MGTNHLKNVATNCLKSRGLLHRFLPESCSRCVTNAQDMVKALCKSVQAMPLPHHWRYHFGENCKRLAFSLYQTASDPHPIVSY